MLAPRGAMKLAHREFIPCQDLIRQAMRPQYGPGPGAKVSAAPLDMKIMASLSSISRQSDQRNAATS